ncbi:CopG family transcriptional regulator [Mycobacterium simiae]|uniref:CopG family transcriptional regulator n=1 Tax=Mycobacterium simiae TaxID=1784 RepID=UPI0021CD35D1|nr:CopG family transcriptional regulator [Mycobacterium simiae]
MPTVMHHDAAAAIIGFVRTTVVIDSDVASEIERLRREGMGLSEALNLLARRGMTRGAPPKSVVYKHRTSRIGLKVDVTNVADVLDLLDDDR